MGCVLVALGGRARGGGGGGVGVVFFFLMIRRPPRSTLDRSSAASDVYKRQLRRDAQPQKGERRFGEDDAGDVERCNDDQRGHDLSLIHISEPTRPY